MTQNFGAEPLRITQKFIGLLDAALPIALADGAACKWHEESAQGLLDLVRLADHVDGLLRQRLRRDDSTRFWGAVW